MATRLVLNWDSLWRKMRSKTTVGPLHCLPSGLCLFFIDAAHHFAMDWEQDQKMTHTKRTNRQISSSSGKPYCSLWGKHQRAEEDAAFLQGKLQTWRGRRPQREGSWIWLRPVSPFVASVFCTLVQCGTDHSLLPLFFFLFQIYNL